MTLAAIQPTHSELPSSPTLTSILLGPRPGFMGPGGQGCAKWRDHMDMSLRLFLLSHGAT